MCFVCLSFWSWMRSVRFLIFQFNPNHNRIVWWYLWFIIKPRQSLHLGMEDTFFSLIIQYLKTSNNLQNSSTIRQKKFRVTAVVLLIGCDLLFTTLRNIFWLNIKPKVSISAHICGGIGGFLTGFVFFKKNIINKTRC